MEWMTFPALEFSELRHAFSLRSTVPLPELETDFYSSASLIGFSPATFAQAEQTHGNGVAVVSEPTQERVSGVDALITNAKGLTLVIRVADCGPVYVYDPVQKAIGLAHSGRKGTEQNITGATIERMGQIFGSRPSDLVVQLGPCIRPPHYEVDFAAEIGRQARACGVIQYHDCLQCTACNLEQFYSYRAEKGKTGRMWALLGLE